MTPLRRPRDTLGGMQSGAPSLHSPSPYPSRSDMSMRRVEDRFETQCGEKLINSSYLTRIKFDLAYIPEVLERLTVGIKASHAGTVAGLVRSPETRNKSSPSTVPLIFHTVQEPQPQCMTRNDENELMLMRKKGSEKKPIQRWLRGCPKPYSILPKTHRCQSAHRGELALQFSVN
ncbi:hypothetical protein PAMA_002975 [Pampus argenteus]